ncbi:hypothetical protein RJT34_04487 [Clitoria ternatea]|uniref:glucan endo-1,3-beta-D-glucosidase n=1 Tax=Clitoria ternatea TaxID=43366 RepID=A0AAN9KP55_CLITE
MACERARSFFLLHPSLFELTRVRELRPPNNGSLKMNFDAVNASNSSTGFGLVIRDHECKCLVAANYNVLCFEVGFEMLYDWDVSQLFVETDYQRLVHAIEREASGSLVGEMSPLAIFLVYLLSLSRAKASSNIGVNYGQLGNNLPSPYRSIELLTSIKAGSVKLYDANPEILRLLSTTNLKVSIMIPNHEISGIAANQSIANEWVRNNVLPYHPKTMIRYLLVGNEVLSINSEQGHQMWHDLVPAMRSIKRSLKVYNIRGIKIGTPLAMDAMQSTFPPSSSAFRPDIRDTVMAPMLNFLNRTNSFLFIDTYPYFPWSQNPDSINLDFALFRGSFSTTDPYSGLIYTNLLDQMLDSLTFAMSKLGYPNIHIVISETGWPNYGNIEEPGANIYNAATYNRNLIQRMTAKPPIGTPARPGFQIPTFIFSLFDENQKPGPGTERHWGMLHPNGTQIYDIDLTGKKPVTNCAPLPAPENNTPYKGKVWCVAAKEANEMELEAALSSICNEENMNCDALAPGRECYQQAKVKEHASYVFSSHWAKFRTQGATCHLNGLAEQTTRDPSELSFSFLTSSHPVYIEIISLNSFNFVHFITRSRFLQVPKCHTLNIGKVQDHSSKEDFTSRCTMTNINNSSFLVQQ